MHYPPIYVLRHGETRWNAEKRLQGRLDSALTEVGIKQAVAQRKILAGRDLAGFRVVSSPQGRSVHTAVIAMQGLLPDIHTDARLSEIGMGAWQGQVVTELLPDLSITDGEEYSLHVARFAPGGEGLQALADRCAAFLAELDGPTVVVTHGVTSRMLRLIATARDPADMLDIPGGQGVVYYVENGRQTKLTNGA